MPFLSVVDGRAVSKGYKGKKLTPKMVEWIDLYMIHMNGVKATELSSYKTKDPRRHAGELLQHPLIIEEIDKRLKARSEKHTITAEFVVQKLVDIVDRTEKDSPQAALKGLELMGKFLGMWREKQEISGPDGGAIKHEQTVREDVADFTSRISSLAKRTGTDNVVKFPDGRSEGES